MHENLLLLVRMIAFRTPPCENFTLLEHVPGAHRESTVKPVGPLETYYPTTALQL